MISKSVIQKLYFRRDNYFVILCNLIIGVKWRNICVNLRIPKILISRMNKKVLEGTCSIR